jgi:anti-anti-sigma regulatory factor
MGTEPAVPLPGHGAVEPISIDVGHVLRGSVESVYSHLVTRPTGRAVRLAIEEQVAATSRTALSLIDLSDVTIMDFSCADEIVAKLLMRFLEEDRPADALFVFKGVRRSLHEQIQTVLERQDLLAVAQDSDGGCELMGTRTEEEEYVWTVLEERGRIVAAEVDEVFPGVHHRGVLDELVLRRVAFTPRGERIYHALSTLVDGAP